MKSIMVYDNAAEELEKIADANDATTAEIVEMLLEYVDEMRKNYWLK